MTHYNPMLEKLQRQIQEYNKDTENRIEEVANRQNLITLAFVVFNIVVFIVLESVLGKREPILLDIPNTVINFVATLILLLVSFPLASKFAKRSLSELQLNEEQIDANMNFAGIWEYETNFHVESSDDGSKTFKLLQTNMDGFEEKGLSKWTQNVFELKINFAHTDPHKEQTKNAKTEPTPHVIWESNPISFNENRINWSFAGEISWKNNENYANTFCGVESYTVIEHDTLGRPSYLQGKLVGTVLVGENFYVVSAVSKFVRKI